MRHEMKTRIEGGRIREFRVCIQSHPFTLLTHRGRKESVLKVWSYTTENNQTKHYLEVNGLVVYRGEGYAAKVQKIINGNFQFPKQMLK